MIAPRHSTHATESDSEGRQIAIHLHVPDRIADALMQLVVTLSQQRSLFPDFTSSVTTHPHQSHVASVTGETATRPAATRVAESSPAEQPAADTLMDSPESLLEIYQTKLQAKRSRSAGKKAIAEHLSSCRSFDQFLREQKHLRCTEPMVNTLKASDLLHTFARWAILEKDQERITVAKRIGHVSMVAREAFGLKLDRPTPKELKTIEDSRQKKKLSDGRRIPSFEEVDALARAAHVAKWPYRSHAPYFWRGLIRFAALIGFRTQDIVSFDAAKTGLGKSDVIWETACPIADVNHALGYVLQSPHGWLHYAIGKDTHSDCKRILIPMPKWLRDWVRFFFELSEHSERLFPSMKQGALCPKTYGKTWAKIVKEAGVDRRIKLSEGTGDIIAIRKYAANWWTLAAIRSKDHAAIADKISHYVLHHAEVTTATKHYLSTQAAVLPAMLQLLSSWPLPAADAQPVSMLPE